MPQHGVKEKTFEAWFQKTPSSMAGRRAESRVSEPSYVHV